MYKNLLNTTFKIYREIINDRLLLIDESLILEEQYGFQRWRPTTDNIFVLNISGEENWIKCRDAPYFCGP